MRFVIDFVFAMLFGCAFIAIAWNIQQEHRLDNLERNQAALVEAHNAHYADSTNCVSKIYADLNNTRFAVKAIANTLKFVTGK